MRQDNRRVFWILAAGFAALILSVYFFLFFQYGIVWDGVFLREKKIDDKTTSYSAQGAEVLRTVISEKETHLRFSFQEGAPFDWVVRREPDGGPSGVLVSVIDPQGVEFEWAYAADGFLMQEQPNGDWETVWAPWGPISEPAPQLSQFTVVEIALGDARIRRGNGYAFFGALLIGALGVLLWKFPLFFFRLEHMWDCVNAEPSDWYFLSTKISAGVLIFFGLLLLWGPLFLF